MRKNGTENYLIRTKRHGEGKQALFWRPNSCGYTYNPDLAGRYTKEYAENCKTSTHGDDIPVPVSRIGYYRKKFLTRIKRHVFADLDGTTPEQAEKIMAAAVKERKRICGK